MSYRTALITGASSGLGRGLALHFAKQGVKVYAAARRATELQALEKEAPNGLVVALPLDVGDADRAHQQIAALDAECGGLDLVVANAGVGSNSYGKRVNWEGISQLLKVNVLGAAATLTAAVPGMVQRGQGHLVGISSLAAYLPVPGTFAYSSSKAFLRSFLDGLRLDLSGTGVTVGCIHPGYVKSEMTAHNKPEAMPFLLETDDAVARMAKAIERRAAVFDFPWQTATAIKTLAALPRGISGAVVKRFR